MFNFCVVLAGSEMVTDIGRATTCTCKFKAASLQKVQKMKEFPKNWATLKNNLKISVEEKEKNFTLRIGKQLEEHEGLKCNKQVWTL